MSEEKLTTTVDYPTLEIGEKKYTLKFTRGLMFRLDEAGIDFNPQLRNGTWNGKYSTIVKVLSMAIGFEGTHEELSELMFDRRDEILAMLVEAWGKVVLPSLQLRVAAMTAAKQSAETPKPQLQ